MSLSKRYDAVGQKVYQEILDARKDVPIELRRWEDKDVFKGMSIFEELAFSAGMVTAHKGEKNGLVTRLSRSRDTYTIIVPRTRTSVNLAIMLHELGHIVNGDLDPGNQYEKEMEKMRVLWTLEHPEYVVGAERAASQWAIDKMREHNVLTKRAVHFLNLALKGYDADRGIVSPLTF